MWLPYHGVAQRKTWKGGLAEQRSKLLSHMTCSREYILSWMLFCQSSWICLVVVSCRIRRLCSAGVNSRGTEMPVLLGFNSKNLFHRYMPCFQVRVWHSALSKLQYSVCAKVGSCSAVAGEVVLWQNKLIDEYWISVSFVVHTFHWHGMYG